MRDHGWEAGGYDYFHLINQNSKSPSLLVGFSIFPNWALFLRERNIEDKIRSHAFTYSFSKKLASLLPSVFLAMAGSHYRYRHWWKQSSVNWIKGKLGCIPIAQRGEYSGSFLSSSSQVLLYKNDCCPWLDTQWNNPEISFHWWLGNSVGTQNEKGRSPVLYQRGVCFCSGSKYFWKVPCQCQVGATLWGIGF